MNRIWYLAGMLALGVSISGAPSAFAAAGPNVVNVVAKEYQYTMPDSIPAGPTLFHLTDAGKQLHHMTIVKFAPGKTIADLTSLPPGPFPAWAVFMGGPNAPMPMGGQDEDVLDLSPGHYAAICLIPGPDGKPHMMDGMVKAFTVTPSAKKGTMPATDLTLKLVNFAFEFSKAPTAGHHVIRVVNDGSLPHEAEIFRMQPDKTGEDVLKWLSAGMQGPPPGAPVAGITTMVPGKENTLLIDFSRGAYAVLCFVPAKDGKPHAAHGMIYNFKVI
jgi:uncharacterized cupredoxin-like copper-binding protein